MAWWYQVRRQRSQVLMIFELDFNQVHCQSKLLIIQITVAIIIRQVPNFTKDGALDKRSCVSGEKAYKVGFDPTSRRIDCQFNKNDCAINAVINSLLIR